MNTLIFLLACIIVFGFRAIIGQGREVVDVNALLAMAIGGFIALGITEIVKYLIKH